VDLSAYERALALDPSFAPARHAHDTLSGERARKAQAHKRYAALAALALLMAIAALSLRRRAVPASAQLTPESQ
jgi:hypothetical protein